MQWTSWGKNAWQEYEKLMGYKEIGPCVFPYGKQQNIPQHQNDVLIILSVVLTQAIQTCARVRTHSHTGLVTSCSSGVTCVKYCLTLHCFWLSSPQPCRSTDSNTAVRSVDESGGLEYSPEQGDTLQHLGEVRHGTARSVRVKVPLLSGADW